MRRGIVWVQGMLILGVVGLVVAFFASGMLALGRQASRKSSAESSV